MKKVIYFFLIFLALPSSAGIKYRGIKSKSVKIDQVEVSGKLSGYPINSNWIVFISSKAQKYKSLKSPVDSDGKFDLKATKVPVGNDYNLNFGDMTKSGFGQSSIGEINSSTIDVGTLEAVKN